MAKSKLLTSDEPASATDHVFLTEQDVADRWRISIKTLQADRYQGATVPFCKIRRSVRYRLADIIAYEERQVRQSTTDTGNRHNTSIKEVLS